MRSTFSFSHVYSISFMPEPDQRSSMSARWTVDKYFHWKAKRIENLFRKMQRNKWYVTVYAWQRVYTWQHQYSHLVNNSYSFRWFSYFRLLFSIVYEMILNCAKRLSVVAAAYHRILSRNYTLLSGWNNCIHFHCAICRGMVCVVQTVTHSIHTIFSSRTHSVIVFA